MDWSILFVLFILILLVLYLTPKVNVPVTKTQTPQLTVDQHFVKNFKGIRFPIKRWCDYIIQYKFPGDVIQDMQTVNNPNTKFLKIPNSRFITNKKQLPITLGGKVSRLGFMPLSHILPEQYSEYAKTKGTFYILKQDVQRQGGLYITQNPPPLDFLQNQKFVVAQKYITNPILFRGYKFNLRYYLSVYINPTEISFRLSPDGVVTYATQPYRPPQPNQQIDPNQHICSFYYSDELYKNFPISIKQLIQKLGERPSPMTPCFEKFGLDYQQLWHQINQISGKLVQSLDRRIKSTFATQPQVGSNVHAPLKGKFYEFFGVDFQLFGDPQHPSISILEVNPVPECHPMDQLINELDQRP